jgi:hypothetical protein
MLGFVAWWWMHDPKADFAPIASTGFTLAFVAAALFLLASGLLQTQAAAVQRAMRWLAVGLLLLYLRRFVPEGVPGALLDGAISIVPLAAAAALFWVAGRPWPGLALSVATSEQEPVKADGQAARVA